MDAADLKAKVIDRYGKAARGVGDGGCCGGGCDDPITANLYGEAHASAVPADAMRASLGCGNPTALAALKPGQVVLDLGVWPAASTCCSPRAAWLRVAGVSGLDMTDDMLAVAEDNKRKTGLENVTFLRGEIEHIPLPNASVDVVISNCVINSLRGQGSSAARAFRVLKPGGRFAVSDVVVRGTVPDAVRKSMELWVGCIAGALGDAEYVAKLARAGFADITLEDTRVYDVTDARAFLAANGLDAERSRRSSMGRS